MHDAFLRAILENPADDVPRLVYADFLEDQGKCERAEFIRIQCELARLAPCRTVKRGVKKKVREYRARVAAGTHEDLIADPEESFLRANQTGDSYCRTPCRFCDLRKKEKMLGPAAVASDAAWMDDLFDGKSTKAMFGECGAYFYENASMDRPSITGWQYSRGFISTAHLSCADWLAHGEALLGAAPLERVELTQMAPASVWLTPAGKLCCRVSPRSDRPQRYCERLTVRDGCLWYVTKPDGAGDSFEIQVIPADAPAIGTRSIEDRFREWWERESAVRYAREIVDGSMTLAQARRLLRREIAPSLVV